jgi:hypothetical protein
MSEQPRVLYKYLPCDRYNADIILCNQLRFTRPKSFNDPFDCRFHIVFDGTPVETKTFLIEGTVSNHPEWSKKRVETWVDQILQTDVYEKTIANFSQLYVEKELERLEVLCLSRKRDDILMWSHYAEQHTGICLGFDTKKWPILQDHAKHINYQDKYPRVNALGPRRESAVQDIVFRKSTRWCYEEEWRVVRAATESQQYIFPPEALVEVIFGYRVSSRDMKMVIIMAYRSSCDPTFWKTAPSDDRYELEVKPLEIKDSMVENWLKGLSLDEV